MKNKIKFLAVIFSVLMLVSCKEDKKTYSKIKDKQTPAKSITHKIVINEALDGGNYTYLNVEEEGNKYWMAITNTEVVVGDTYYYDGGMKMKDFNSKYLNKTFDYIIFAEGVRTTEQGKVKPPKKPRSNSETPEIEVVKIEKPVNGTSLNELFSNKESFSNKAIKVKGKVTKVNINIMGKNWVHLSDGTEFEGKKSLSITTLDNVKVGDVVTFEGIIILDKDFGQGYFYDVLLQEGKLVK